MQKCPNKCARFPRGLTPTAAKEVVQSVWNTFHRSVFTMPKFKAEVLCSCGNAQASAAYIMQKYFCVPKQEEPPFPWIPDVRKQGWFCCIERHYQRQVCRDHENPPLLKGVRESLNFLTCVQFQVSQNKRDTGMMESVQCEDTGGTSPVSRGWESWHCSEWSQAISVVYGAITRDSG